MNNLSVIPVERFESKIYFLRGKKVMLDKDLSGLYGVPTRILNQAVKRNFDRFPEDFMFKLSNEESESFSNKPHAIKRGKNIKFAPYAFTEQGVAMLSSVLKSETAIQVNIQIIRTFVKMREILVANKDLRDKIYQLEEKYDKNFEEVFEMIEKLLDPAELPVEVSGFN